MKFTLKVFNKTGGQYSSSETSQRYLSKDTKQIELIDDTIFAQPNQIYQIRFPEKDIKKQPNQNSFRDIASPKQKNKGFPENCRMITCCMNCRCDWFGIWYLIASYFNAIWKVTVLAKF